jgi:pimeloyl-ACP methyl ester carboxylesterase
MPVETFSTKGSIKERILIVILHAYTGSPENMAAVEAIARRAFVSRDVEIHCPRLPLSLFSLVSPTAIACELVRQIDGLWNGATLDGRPFTHVIFVGHSVGSLIARKVYVLACGETEEAPFEQEVDLEAMSPWAPHVDRIILLAGMNQGWRVTHHLSLWRAPVWWLGSLIGRLFEILTGRALLILQVRRGGRFITQLRIQWLKMRQRAARESGTPGSCLAVQLLGSIDDYVSPKDNIDLVAGGDFVYLDVPYSGHANIIEMQDEAVPRGSTVTVGDMRREVFGSALTLSSDALQNTSVLPDDSEALPSRNLDVRDVIFVIHGIRDEGFWTHKVARAIRKRMPEHVRTVATETSSYGYFPMLPFLFAGRRREKVEWLMDQYATAIATYPNAERFHFVGHSNGTYCLTEALRLYPCCKFENVVLAGSVVRTRFPWNLYLRGSPSQAGLDRPIRGSVGKVLNFTATSDWVVAVFPKLFQTALPLQRLGSAGHDGFEGARETVEQIGYVRGGHGAAIAEPIWPAIAEFVASGEVPTLDEGLVRRSRNPLVVFLGLTPWLWWLLIAFGVYLGADWIVPRPGETYAEVVARMVLLAAYFGALFRVFTWL